MFFPSFLQVAVPAMLCALEAPLEFDQSALRTITYLLKKDRDLFEQVYSTSISGVHPFTLDDEEVKERLLNFLALGDPSL